MNKRAILILGIITLFFGAAYITNKIIAPKEQENIVADEMILSRDKEAKAVEQSTVNASVEEEKTTPNTVLVLKKNYTDCGHTITDTAEIPSEMVNLTKEELSKKYENWKIESFAKEKVVLSKELDSFCGEHYLVIEEENIVSIYLLDEGNNRTLVENTDIAFDYLPETDKIILSNGIYVYGKEELNKIKEDFE